MNKLKLSKSLLIDLLYVVLIGLSSLLSFHKIFDPKVDLNGDNIVYYSLGQALHEDMGFVNLIGPEHSPHGHYPIGYPWIISQIMNFSTEYNAVKWCNGIFLMLGLIVCFFIFKKLSGNRHLAFIACFLGSINTAMLNFATIMMSEMSFFLVTSTGILLLLSIPKGSSIFRPFQWKNCALAVGAALLIVFSSHVRSIGTTLVISAVLFSVFGIFQKTDRLLPLNFKKPKWSPYLSTALLVLVFFFAAKFLWTHYMENLGMEKVRTDYFGQLSTKTGGGEMLSWNDWSNRIEQNIKTYIPQTLLGSTFFPLRNYQTIPTSYWISGWIALILLVWGILRAKKGSVLFLFYLGGTAVTLLLWPQQWSGDRFIIGIIPFIIFFILYGLYEAVFLLCRKIQPRWNTSKTGHIITAAIVFLCLVIVPKDQLKAMENRAKMSRHKTYNVYNSSPALINFKLMCEFTKEYLPDSALIVSRKPEVAYIFSKRTNFCSFPYHAGEDELFDYLVKKGADYIIVDAWFSHAYKTIYPVTLGKYKDHFKIVQIINVDTQNPHYFPCILYRFSPDAKFEGEETL